MRKRLGSGGCLKRVLLGLMALPVALIGVGLLYETVADARERRRYAAPGQMVDVGTHRLHLQVMGEDRELPTVVLEHAGGAFSAQWAWIQPALAQHTRVVSYDRPGMGWSEAGPDDLDAQQAVDDLYRALQQVGAEGPYVLVGHSMGSLMARLFAESYAEEVVGLALVDPRDVSWEVPGAPVTLMTMMSRVGFFRVTGMAASQAQGLPPPAYEQGVALWSSHKHWRNMGTETFLGDNAAERLGDDSDLRGQTFVILTATEADASFGPDVRALWLAQHEALAQQAARGRHELVAGADHVTLVSNERYAQAVSDAVLSLLQGEVTVVD